MRSLRWLIIALLCIAAPASAFWQSRDSDYNKNISAAAPYQGPGDVVSGATEWWGLRCYTAAYSGNVADIWDASTGSTTETVLGCDGAGNIVVKSGSTLATTCASGCKVKTLYDQSGSNKCSGGVACDLTQATNSKRAAYTANCIGILPCLTFTTSGVTGYSSVAALTSGTGTAVALTVSSVVERTASFTLEGDWLATSGGGFCSNFFNTTANTVAIYQGSAAKTATASDSVIHAINNVFNGVNSGIVVDGSVTTANSPGTVSCTGSWAVAGNSGTHSIDGIITEIGVWVGTAFTPTQYGNMNTNQHSFWGF